MGPHKCIFKKKIFLPFSLIDAIYANEFLKAAREEVRYNDLKDGKLKVKYTYQTFCLKKNPLNDC